MVPLAAVAIGGYIHTHPPDKRVADPSLPYAFDYPGAWERDPPEDLPRTGAGYVAGVSKQVETSVTEGVLVQVFEYEPPERLAGVMRRDLKRRGGTAVARSELTVAGYPAFRIDAEMSPGVPLAPRS